MNIKKCTSLFLVFLLLVSNVGMAFNVHYCGDQIASVSLNSGVTSLASEKRCCDKFVSEKEPCCKDKEVKFEKKSDTAIVKALSFEPNTTFLIPEKQTVTVPLVADGPSPADTAFFYYCDANVLPLFKLYSQYIFYA